MATQLAVAEGRVVGIYYTVKNAQGEVIDSSSQRGSKPLAFLMGAGNVVAGLEKALDGKVKDDHVEVDVPPEEAYGQPKEELIETMKRSDIPYDGDIQPGMHLVGTDPSGRQIRALVTAVGDDDVTLDRNHPLAGQTIRFEVTIAGVREATPEETEHGHPHGPGGHDH